MVTVRETQHEKGIKGVQEEYKELLAITVSLNRSLVLAQVRGRTSRAAALAGALAHASKALEETGDELRHLVGGV